MIKKQQTKKLVFLRLVALPANIISDRNLNLVNWFDYKISNDSDKNTKNSYRFRDSTVQFVAADYQEGCNTQTKGTTMDDLKEGLDSTSDSCMST